MLDADRAIDRGAGTTKAGPLVDELLGPFGSVLDRGLIQAFGREPLIDGGQRDAALVGSPMVDADPSVRVGLGQTLRPTMDKYAPRTI
jgi:hypothetical protein